MLNHHTQSPPLVSFSPALHLTNWSWDKPLPHTWGTEPLALSHTHYSGNSSAPETLPAPPVPDSHCGNTAVGLAFSLSP